MLNIHKECLIKAAFFTERLLNVSSIFQESSNKRKFVACSQCGEKKIWVTGQIKDYQLKCFDCLQIQLPKESFKRRVSISLK
jgi:formylmethanofuran dehydrogenase subunit E